MKARGDEEQLNKLWGSLSVPGWHDGSHPESLDDLDLLPWESPGQPMTETSLLSSADIDCLADDLLPTMRFLMEASDVSGSSAFPASWAADSAESSPISFLNATILLDQPQPENQPASRSQHPLRSSPAATCTQLIPETSPAPLPGGTPMIPIAVETPRRECELPAAAMRSTGYTLLCRPADVGMPPIPSQLPRQCCLDTGEMGAQLDAAALAVWESCTGGGFDTYNTPQDPARDCSAERMGSTASDDSFTFTVALAPAAPAGAAAAAWASFDTCAADLAPAAVGSAGAQIALEVSPAGWQVRRPASRPLTAAPAAGRRTAAEKNRDVQREYLQRKQARTEAVHAQVGDLEARRAELLAQLGPLLTRHEQLTRSLPWHKQQEEWGFMAEIASCAPGGADSACPPDLAPAADPIQSMMLEPDATVEQLYASAGLQSSIKDEAAPFKPLCLAPAPKDAAKFDSAPWQRLVARLRLTKTQREGIAAGYNNHIQSEAFLQEDCLGIAAKLQKLPKVVGELSSSLQPNLVTHLMGCQLAGISKRGDELTQRLTRTCFQVFNKAQMDILRELIFTIPLDMRALCREIATAGLSKGRARSGVTSALTNPPKKRPAVRAPEAGQDDISADVARDISHRNTSDSVPRKRRLAGPSPSQGGPTRRRRTAGAAAVAMSGRAAKSGDNADASMGAAAAQLPKTGRQRK